MMMNEMLPESWIPEAQDVSPPLRRPSCRAPITDVLAWTGIGPQDSNTRNTGDWEPVSDLERTGRVPDLSPALSHWFDYIQL